MKTTILLLLALGLSGCGDNPQNPITRCISHGKPIDKCIELAHAIHRLEIQHVCRKEEVTPDATKFPGTGL